MSIIQEIRQQPEWMRGIMFVLAIFVTISTAGMVWFNSFERDIFTLINPEDELPQKQYYVKVEDQSRFSLVALIGKGVGSLKAGMYALFDFDDVDGLSEKNKTDHGEVYLLPLSENR